MRLVLLNPGIAARSCDECRKYLYDDRGNLLRRGGLPVPRPPQSRTPCRTCPKIPPGEPAEPESAVELTEQHRETVRFYRECRAVGQFPNDPLVRWAAAIIRAAEDHAERVRSHRMQLNVLSELRGG